jgi:hypothetical protein
MNNYTPRENSRAPLIAVDGKLHRVKVRTPIEKRAFGLVFALDEFHVSSEHILTTDEKRAIDHMIRIATRVIGVERGEI